MMPAKQLPQRWSNTFHQISLDKTPDQAGFPNGEVAYQTNFLLLGFHLGRHIAKALFRYARPGNRWRPSWLSRAGPPHRRRQQYESNGFQMCLVIDLTVDHPKSQRVAI